MTTALFWDFTRRRMVVSYRYVFPKRRYETTILRCVKSQNGADLNDRLILLNLLALFSLRLPCRHCWQPKFQMSFFLMFCNTWHTVKVWTRFTFRHASWLCVSVITGLGAVLWVPLLMPVRMHSVSISCMQSTCFNGVSQQTSLPVQLV